jgi:hypothetical protein
VDYHTYVDGSGHLGVGPYLFISMRRPDTHHGLRCNSSFGVFLSYYRTNQCALSILIAFWPRLCTVVPDFPGATDTDFAFIGGMSISLAMLIAPFSNYLSKRYNFKVPLSVGVVVYVLSQIFAGLSKHIWQLFLTQGVMFGFGLGLVRFLGRCMFLIT